MSRDIPQKGTLHRMQLVSAIVGVAFAIIVSVASSITSGAWWAGELTTEIKHLNKQLEKVIEEGYTRREAEAEFKHIKEIINIERSERLSIQERVSALESKMAQPASR